MKKTNKHRLFSKALFKQSCKANGLMWGIITLAVCFTLACVMLISGTSSISTVKTGVQDTIIEEIMKSEIKKSSVNLYQNAKSGEEIFDIAFAEKFNELNTEENAIALKEIEAKATATATVKVQAKVAEMVKDEVTNRITKEVNDRVASEESEILSEVSELVEADMATSEASEKVSNKVLEGKTLEEAKQEVIAEYTEIEKEKVIKEHVGKATLAIATDLHKAEVTKEVLEEKGEAYKASALELLNDEIAEIKSEAKADVEKEMKERYITPSYLYAINKVLEKFPNTEENKSNYGAVMVTINPNQEANSQYEANNEEIPEEYINAFISYMLDDINSLESGEKTETLLNYVKESERNNFTSKRAYKGCSMLISSKINSPEFKQTILETLKSYKVDEKKYDSMGFNYKSVYDIAYGAMLEYQGKYEYAISNIPSEIKADDVLYEERVKEIKEEIYSSVAGSLLDKLPQNVSDGIEELGTMDLYGLIVGSIFFKMAGLLLPIIYVIMVSNNLIAGQVDNGSMAYVLSTSTRREEVTFTQAVYLVGSLFLMFVCTTITSLVCFALANVNTDLTYAKLIFINMGAFAVLFAISGINYLSSCYFDRSKRAMALGGGISIFFLVATMLGLFGSSVIPSVVRISALNNFNYVSLISLFDVVSILRSQTTWLWKLSILIVVGITGYILGAIKFKKKDLPL